MCAYTDVALNESVSQRAELFKKLQNICHILNLGYGFTHVDEINSN